MPLLPQGEHLYDFSYSRSNGKFRWRLNDQVWVCNRIAGDAYIVGCNNEHGNMGIYCRIVEGENGTFYTYLDDPSVADALTMNDLPELAPLPSNGTVKYPETHNELDEHVQAGFLPDELFRYDKMPDEPRNWRLCYHRAGNDWRVRDERVGRLWLVQGYRGPVKLSWFDGGTHIFADNVVTVDEDKIAHFGVR